MRTEPLANHTCTDEWDARVFRVSPSMFAGGQAVHPLLQWETGGWKFLPGSSKTQRYAELNLFRYDGLLLEALRPLFGTRGVVHPKPEPR